MPSNRKIVISALISVLACTVGIATQYAASQSTTIKFADVSYIHRWSKNDQHEFTPQGQENLDHWSDMVTINHYRNTRNGESLAAVANAVLENYKAHHARILRTNSVPRTADKPAEHFVAALFTQPEFMEVAFARFEMINGLGASVVYSHREYGNKVGDQMGAWLEKGASVEKTLMALEHLPSADELAK